MTYRAKTSSPRLHRVVYRERLFRQLDELGQYPVTWVSSPAGAGKTTLVASYVRFRNIPVIWYRVDEADSDVADFFYYIGEAARSLKKGRAGPLPRFTSECRAGILSFTRRYFESLYTRMPFQGMIVLDNYQHIGEDAEFHEVIRNGLRLAPEGIRVLLLSRKEPPPHFISLKAESMMGSLGWDSIRFTRDEVGEMMRLRVKDAVPEEVVKRVHHETRGWAAAIVLAQDSGGMLSLSKRSIGLTSVFDYLGAEVLRNLDEDMLSFLLVTSLLPTVTPEVADALIGIPDSGRILDHLSRNHYFTERYGDVYRYHPLFREYLLTLAEKSFTSEEMRISRRDAGKLLIDSGRPEEGVDLLLAAREWEALIPAILSQAPRLLAEGRSRTLGQWIDSVPGKIRVNTPWLLFWYGMVRREPDPGGSVSLFDRAFELFRECDDAAGALLAWSSAVLSIGYAYRDLRLLDERIDWLDSYAAKGLPFPSPDIECTVAAQMTFALMIRRPYHPGFTGWIERTVALSAHTSDPSLRLFACHASSFAYMWLGEFARWALTVGKLKDLAKSGGPFEVIWWHAARAALLNETGSFEESPPDFVEPGLKMCADYRIDFAVPYLMAEGCYLALNTGDLTKAGAVLAELEGLLDGPSDLGHVRYHASACNYYVLTGNLPRALTHGHELLRTAVETGGFFPEAIAHLYLAFILIESGRLEEARDHIAAFKAMPETPSLILLYTRLIAEAALALHEGSDDARNILKEAFRLGRMQGYSNPFYWRQPSLMARLCRAALTWGIEDEHVRRVMAKYKIVPDDTDVDRWHWPLRIFTFGRFGIEVNGEQLAFSGKVQKRPLLLLKALVSLGGNDVRQETIEDILWPQAEGDAARIAFRTTLSRLRKLIGIEGAIQVKEGKVRLNEKIIWVDARALENLAGRVAALRVKGMDRQPGEAARLASLALEIYRGEFLANHDEPWITPLREGMKNRFLKTARKLMDILNHAGETEKALFLFENLANRGIPLDETRNRATPGIVTSPK